ncbi:SAG-related sequence SRS34A [Besnoitia besnoiti]|uniref:SAG-related sequence SRS34A n=1 Tax=Besnoitia besnoiti TaxID=94643 RepID=A0A2A9MNJ1_BESBE|nr:SAG-related sequence SRS34A [Besnoitia besnoiti]PFH37270.1 SAG-related sequence SRS34A [Besnoitia besnoiti]
MRHTTFTFRAVALFGVTFAIPCLNAFAVLSTGSLGTGPLLCGDGVKTGEAAPGKSFTFQCGSNFVLDPENTDYVYEGSECSNPRSLKQLIETAELTGPTRTGRTTHREAPVGVYTLAMERAPDDLRVLCYKCIEQDIEPVALSAALMRGTSSLAQAKKECRVVITVKGTLNTTKEPPPTDFTASGATDSTATESDSQITTEAPPPTTSGAIASQVAMTAVFAVVIVPPFPS